MIVLGRNNKHSFTSWETMKGNNQPVDYMEILDDKIDTRALKYDLTDLMYRYYGTELKGIHGGMNETWKESSTRYLWP